MLRSLVVVTLLAAPALGEAPCATVTGAELRVASHRLWLCDGGRAEASFSVALGRGGLGKQRSGDGRTPTGRYPLGEPRPSVRYRTFIPVGYPTAAQRRSGFGGADIGVHGPTRGARILAAATTWVDWTRGCIALPTDEAIDAVAAWVRRRHARAITIAARLTG